MKRQTQKLTDVLLIGDGSYVHLIKDILTQKYNRTVRQLAGNYTFIDSTTVAVSGEKTAARKILVDVFAHKPRVIQCADHSRVSVVIGSSASSMHGALQLAETGSKVTLLCPSTILPLYDSTVQDVFTRLFRKVGIALYEGSTILDVDPTQSAIKVIAEYQGKPVRIVADYLYEELAPESVDASPFENRTYTSQLFEIYDNKVVHLLDPNSLTIENAYQIADFLSGKKTLSKKNQKPRAFLLTDSISLFSIGINEQDYSDTHLSYKRSIVKVSHPDTRAPWCIKLLTSTSGRLIGAHGVVPFLYNNLDLLINLVEQHAPVSNLKQSCLLSDALSETYIKLLEELA